MRIETILNAMGFAHTQAINLAMLERLDPYSANYVLLGRRERQRQTFRERILSMDKLQKSVIMDLKINIAGKDEKIVRKRAMFREHIETLEMTILHQREKIAEMQDIYTLERILNDET